MLSIPPVIEERPRYKYVAINALGSANGLVVKSVRDSERVQGPGIGCRTLGQAPGANPGANSGARPVGHPYKSGTLKAIQRAKRFSACGYSRFYDSPSMMIIGHDFFLLDEPLSHIRYSSDAFERSSLCFGIQEYSGFERAPASVGLDFA